MHLINLILLIALLLVLIIVYFYVLKEESITPLEYTEKTAASYSIDLQNIKNCINKAQSSTHIKMCCEAVYCFRMRYRKFFSYDIDTEADFDELITLIDKRNHYLQTQK
jgi:hypothetical protein